MLRRYIWEKAKEKLQHYRRSTPEASVLYQIVYHSRDDLQFQWESRLQHQYGCLRDVSPTGPGLLSGSNGRGQMVRGYFVVQVHGPLGRGSPTGLPQLVRGYGVKWSGVRVKWSGVTYMAHWVAHWAGVTYMAHWVAHWAGVTFWVAHWAGVTFYTTDEPKHRFYGVLPA